MAIAKLIKEMETFRIYKNSNGVLFKFILEDENELLIEDMNGNSVGEFEFKELEYGNGYKVMRMYTNEYKNTGLGSAALLYFIDVYDGPLYTSNNDGLRRDDGSHLTDDAPSFVPKMIAKGIINGYERKFYEDNDTNGFF
jgi:hypothetical protein